ncbi:MAG: HlyD family efflux transporter periplasmic adaptor subunit [Acidobacteria bacterium]|nr:HlyD family efflux transporter periplasmic adaptor subunit [Acidobacteriota bacterium]
MKWSGKRVVAGVILVVTVAGGVLFYRRLNRPEESRIVFSGNIELTEVSIAFKIPGKLVDLAVGEGDPVRKGQVIARLDQDQLLQQRERARALVASAESQLEQLFTAIQYQRETTRALVEQRQAEVRQAEARLRDLLAGSRPQEVEQARAAVRRARAEYETARADWERAEKLYRSEDISASQYDQFKNRNESATALLKQAEEQLALVLEGPRREQVEAARADVARGRAALQLAESSHLELKRKEQEVPTRRAEIARARADLGVIDAQLLDTVASSPIDGIVLVKAAEVGEVLAAGTAVVTVGDLDHPWLRGYINETDLGRVKPGAEAKVMTDSFRGKVYRGRVSFIASQAEFTPKQIQTPEERVKLVYRVKVDIANPAHELKLNMPADAEIVMGMMNDE